MGESLERVPKIANYYKNYLTFFCNPIFRNFKVNSIIQAYSDSKAELYYNRTYSNKSKKEKKALSLLFDTKIKDEIDQIKLMRNSSESSIHNSMFHDEFFIYKPEKKRYGGDKANDSSLLDFSKNQSLNNLALLTVASKNEDIFDIVSNMTKQPLNDKIIDKIQQKSTKKTGKNTYNFSTTDKSKGDSQNNNAVNNNLTKSVSQSNYNFNNYNKDKEVLQLRELKDSVHRKDSDMKLEDNVSSPKPPTKILQNFQITKITKHENPIVSYKIKATARQNSLEKGLKKSLELVDVANPTPSSSKYKIAIEPTHDSNNPDYSKSIPMSLKYNNPETDKNYNKFIDFKQSQNKQISSGVKFANLLSLDQQGNQADQDKQLKLSNKMSFGKIPIKSIKSIEINKFNADIKSPYASNQLHYYDYSTKMKNDELSSVKSKKGHKPTLSVHIDKVLRPSQSNNYIGLDKLVQQQYAINEINRVKSNDKLYYYRNEDDEMDNKVREEQINNDIIVNSNISANMKYYLNNSKKAIPTGVSDDSNRVLSSLTNTKSTVGASTKIKFQLNDKSPSNYNRLNYFKDSKNTNIMPSTLYNQSSKNSLLRTSSKNNFASTEKDKITSKPANRKMKSTDLYYNNYLNSKIQSTRSVNNYQYVSSSRKINFSPQAISRKI